MESKIYFFYIKVTNNWRSAQFPPLIPHKGYDGFSKPSQNLSGLRSIKIIYKYVLNWCSCLYAQKPYQKRPSTHNYLLLLL